ncbi:hypothetical protein HAX54_027631 [Datura stramonium]|uniref:Uncharacterized protein n=1 Tax=Datura stramonium TaxID=4076 RepID=A0ABS8V520_DATST|nr:hypothetical protein [Datura stramonium]
MFNRFTDITNKLSSLGVIIPQGRRIEKLLDILLDSWERKDNVIMEAKDPETMNMEELMESLKTYEMRKFQTQKNTSPNRDVNLLLTATQVHRSRMTTRQEDQIVKKALASMKKPSSDNEDNETEERNQSLVAKEESNSEDILKLMANSNQESKYDNCETHIFDIKDTCKDLHTL